MKKKRKARSHSSKSINLNVLKKGVTVIFSGADKALTHKDICRQLQVKDKINNNLPTLPTTLADELECNIFLKAKDLKTFSKLRDLKDNF